MMEQKYIIGIIVVIIVLIIIIIYWWRKRAESKNVSSESADEDADTSTIVDDIVSEDHMFGYKPAVDVTSSAVANDIATLMTQARTGFPTIEKYIGVFTIGEKPVIVLKTAAVDNILMGIVLKTSGMPEIHMIVPSAKYKDKIYIIAAGGLQKPDGTMVPISESAKETAAYTITRADTLPSKMNLDILTKLQQRAVAAGATIAAPDIETTEGYPALKKLLLGESNLPANIATPVLLVTMRDPLGNKVNNIKLVETLLGNNVFFASYYDETIHRYLDMGYVIIKQLEGEDSAYHIYVMKVDIPSEISFRYSVGAGITSPAKLSSFTPFLWSIMPNEGTPPATAATATPPAATATPPAAVEAFQRPMMLRQQQRNAPWLRDPQLRRMRLIDSQPSDSELIARMKGFA